jgi:long-chain acyl-CoA synthetase
VNLASIIDDHQADKLALISRGRPTTYGALREQVDHLRGGLASLGVVDGDRVALLCGNGRHFAISYLATLGLGAVAVPLNPLSPALEIETQIAEVGAKVVVIEKLSAPTWGEVDRDAVPSVEHVVSSDEAAHEGVVRIDELLTTEPVDRVEVEPDHLAALLFTSGTGGAPRAAMLTHDNLLSSIEQTLAAGDRLRPDDLVYGILPLFHIFGLNVVLAMTLHVGAAVVLVQRFDPLTAADSIQERSITVVPGVPAMWSAFAGFDELPAEAFASVRLALSGAAKLPLSVAERFEQRFGIPIAEGYGLTEASPTVTTSAGIQPRRGSVGRAVPGVEIRLVNANGEALVGDVGEVLVRGRNVFAGYYDDDEATAATLQDGWLHTGDMGMADDDGYLYLVDRSKDLIIVSGFNVYPAEVEDVLTSHPDVLEAGVVGVPHPHTGEAVRAFVVLADGVDIDEEALIEYCRDHLARYKCPSKVLVTDELPRNAGGKLIRRQLGTSLAIS